MLGSAPATCLYLTSYEVAKDSLTARSELCADHPSLLYLGAGMAAEAVSCVLWVPIDVIKERMQMQKPGASGGAIYYRNTLHAAQTILRTEKLRGLYKGYGATLLSFGPFSALYFMFYEKVGALPGFCTANFCPSTTHRRVKRAIYMTEQGGGAGIPGRRRARAAVHAAECGDRWGCGLAPHEPTRPHQAAAPGAARGRRHRRRRERAAVPRGRRWARTRYQVRCSRLT